MSNPFSSLYAHLARPRWSRKDESLAVRRLSLLIASGMSVPDGLGAISEGTRGRAREGLDAIRAHIEGGERFSFAASLQPGLFSTFSSEVIRVGEDSGSLAENLSYLSRELEKQARLRARLVGSLTYPILLGVLTILLSVALILFVFPKVLPLFSGLGAALPLPTRLMLAISRYLSDWGLVTLLAVCALSIGVTVSVRYIERVNRALLHTTLSLPLIGNMIRAYRLGGIARCLGIMIHAGASVPDALEAAGRASRHALYRHALTQAARSAEEGANVRSALSGIDRALVPPLALDLLSSGEASGTLAEASFHLAAYYENEFDEASVRLSTFVEPVLMILMGLIVGFVALSMILPIYSITNQLHA